MESERKGRKDGESERGVFYHQHTERVREKREGIFHHGVTEERRQAPRTNKSSETAHHHFNTV